MWALLVGFFMILLDATIVSVANPSIMDALNVDYDAVLWVTSAYLLAYAVPLLLAGRLGDRFGPRNMYLVGLAVFTAASLWCGLSDGIETLVAARAVQGIGAALLTPQTLSTITRIFPAAAARRRAQRLGCHRGRRHARRTVGGRRPRRRPGVAVDLHRQRADRHRRAGARLCLRPGRCPRRSPDSTCSASLLSGVGTVHDRVRAAGGSVARLAPVDLGHAAGRRGHDGGLRLLAGGQSPRATDPAEDVP